MLDLERTNKLITAPTLKQVWIWIENCWTSKKNGMMKENTKIHDCNFIHSFGLRIVAKSKQSNFCMDKYICDCMRAFITNIHCIPLLFLTDYRPENQAQPFCQSLLRCQGKVSAFDARCLRPARRTWFTLSRGTRFDNIGALRFN